MPFLFDGYNVYHAACRLRPDWAHIVPITLCQYIAADICRLRDHGVIVFDGSLPRGRPEKVEPEGFLKIIYSGSESDADSLLEKLIQKNTAPRRLLVASSDRRIRRAARRRRAPSVTAQEYLQQMIIRMEQPPRRPSEPKEKYRGVPDGDLEDWLKMFGFDPETDDMDDDTQRCNASVGIGHFLNLS